MRWIYAVLALAIFLLAGCSPEPQQASQPKVFMVEESNEGVFDKEIPTSYSIEGKDILLEENDAYNQWYTSSSERRAELKDFRNSFENAKEDFEQQKKTQYQNIRTVIGGKPYYGYAEAPDMDRSYYISLKQPATKSDSIYAVNGVSHGYVEGFGQKSEDFFDGFEYNDLP